MAESFLQKLRVCHEEESLNLKNRERCFLSRNHPLHSAGVWEQLGQSAVSVHESLGSISSMAKIKEIKF